MPPLFRKTMLVIDGLVILLLALLAVVAIKIDLGLVVFVSLLMLVVALNFYALWKHTGPESMDSAVIREVKDLVQGTLRGETAATASPQSGTRWSADYNPPEDTSPERDEIDPTTRRQTTMDDIERMRRGDT